MFIAAEKQIRELTGPGFSERWLSWKYCTESQRVRSYIKAELNKILSSNLYNGHPPTLAPDEITAVRKNLQNQEIEVDSDTIKQVWYLMFRSQFLKSALNRAHECKREFYMYQQGMESEVNCNDVILFWRLQRMMAATSNALRQQVMNIESRRLEKEIKETLDDFGQDQAKKEQLLTGRRVQIAEELSKYTISVFLIGFTN